MTISNSISTPAQALNEFLSEFGSVARAFNPAALAYSGYKFVEKLIMYQDKAIRAWVAWDTKKENIAIVSENGSFIEFTDYKNVEIYEPSPVGARKLFQMYFPTLWGIFNPADIAYSVTDFAEQKDGYVANDLNGEHKFVLRFGGFPDIVDPS